MFLRSVFFPQMTRCMARWCWRSVLTSLLVLAACGKAEIRHVALVDDDMCARCRMAISEKRYAAELIDRDGEAVKFDDIGCMIYHVNARQNKGPIAAYFVMDFDSQIWLKADEAHYVRSAEFKTPMHGGIVAFKDPEQAQKAAAKYSGVLLRFSNLGTYGGAS